MPHVGLVGGGRVTVVQLPLRIVLCGALAVERDGRRIEDDLSGRQGREVFAYLVLNRSRTVARDELAGLLWPERPPRAPDAAVNTILARLRKSLGGSTLPSRAQLTLQLHEDSWIDVQAAQDAAHRAEALLAEGNANDALECGERGFALICSPLLPEVQHGWIEQWRHELDGVAARLLSVIVRGGLAVGGPRLAEADRAARRLIEREPFRESAYAMLMEVHAARGDVAEALLVYERLRALLRDELGVAPSAAVASLHARLVNTRPHRGPPVRSGSRDDEGAAVPLPQVLTKASERRLVGRTRELSVLLERWRAHTVDRRCVIALAGEPGIGKTMLTACVARTAHRDGAVVLQGRAEEEALVPYGALVEALRHFVIHTSAGELEDTIGIHLGELGWLIPELAHHRAERAAPAGDLRLERLRLYHAASALIAHAAERRPLLLVLEDMQFADADTLLMIRQLLRDVGRHRIVMVLAYRDGEVGGDHPLARLLSDLRREVGVTRLRLRGLDDDAIAELIDGDHQPSGELIERLQEHTDGNPYFVEEVLRSVRDRRPDTDSRAFSIEDLRFVPESVQDVIQARLRRLPSSAREILAGAAVVGQEFDPELLESLFDHEQTADALDLAVREGLLVTDGESRRRYRFRHALAREAIYRSIGHGRRAQLHVRIARALERQRRTTHVDSAQLAHHFLACGRSDVADEAIRYSSDAAERARGSYACDDAAQHYRRALDVLEACRPRDVRTRCSLLLRLGQVSWQRDGPRARVIFEQALTVARGIGEHAGFAEATLGLGGRFYAPVGHDRPYVKLLEEALQDAPKDGVARTRLLGRLAEHLVFVDPNRAVGLSSEALALARQLGVVPLVAATLLSRHATLLHTHHVADRTRLAAEAVELARRVGEHELEALGHHWLLYDLLEAGDVDLARPTLDRLEGLANELRQPLYRHSALTWRRVLAQLGGAFELAEQLAHEALNLAQAAQGEDATPHFIAGQLAVIQDCGQPQTLLPAVLEQAAGGGRMWYCAARLLAFDCAEAQVGVREPTELASDHLARLPRDVYWLTTLAWLAEISARTNDRQRAEVLHELLAPYADRCVQLTFTGSFGSVHRHLALLASQLDQPRVATEHFEEAVRRHAAIRAPALEARTLCDFADAIVARRAAGAKPYASEMRTRARALAASCGATNTLERLTLSAGGLVTSHGV
jgi:DNA-binding SARP family transcriptional activator